MPQRPPYISYNIGKETLDFLEHEISNTPGDVQDGNVGGSNSVDNIRRSKIKFLPNQNIKSFLMHTFSSINRQAFGFNINDIYDIQYSEYDSEYEGHYDWHIDVAWNADMWYQRKLSISIQLSDGSDYEGGDLEFKEFKTNPEENREKGTIIVFPSYQLHRVTPVTKGKRRALVAWVEGPQFT
jgi:predicted 2-oxoglutarate/Fe(II)-dependent dioxygenase YbiX